MRARETAAVGRILRNGSLVDPALPASLARIDVATFLLWGREDRVIPAAQAQAWAALLPRSTVRVVADAGHLILDESGQARGEVKAFLLRSGAAA
jgi:pimeloyl-ACP methyl ester carboxylesterase